MIVFQFYFCFLLIKNIFTLIGVTEYVRLNETGFASCSIYGQWYIRDPNDYIESNLNIDNESYSVERKINKYNESLWILTINKPINNAIYVSKVEKFKICETTLKQFVYPEDYKAYFEFNGLAVNLSFNYQPVELTFNITTEDPDNFTLNYSYRVEGLPLEHLLIDASNQKNIKNQITECTSKIKGYDCKETNGTLRYKEIENTIHMKFSYFAIDEEAIKAHNLSLTIGVINIHLNVLYPPKLNPFQKIEFNDEETEYLLNCTEQYSNPKVLNYMWMKNGYELKTDNKSTYLFKYGDSSKIDTYHLSCNASNSLFHSIASFEISKRKKQINKKMSILWIIIPCSCAIVILLLVLCCIFKEKLWRFIKRIFRVKPKINKTDNCKPKDDKTDNCKPKDDANCTTVKQTVNETKKVLQDCMNTLEMYANIYGVYLNPDRDIKRTHAQMILDIYYNSNDLTCTKIIEIDDSVEMRDMRLTIETYLQTYLSDIGIASIIFRHFLKHLKKPLFTQEQYDNILKQMSTKYETRKKRKEALLKQLESKNDLDIMIFDHFKKVLEKSKGDPVDVNYLTEHLNAIIFGNLFVNPKESKITEMKNVFNYMLQTYIYDENKEEFIIIS